MDMATKIPFDEMQIDDDTIGAIIDA